GVAPCHSSDPPLHRGWRPALRDSLRPRRGAADRSFRGADDLRLRGALVGAGNIALAGHGPQWARNEALQRDVEIVAVADLSPANLEAARGLFPRAKGYLHVQELWDREAVDFADICTPPFTHRSLVEDAAERGIHVLCEKPLAPSL